MNDVLPMLFVIIAGAVLVAVCSAGLHQAGTKVGHVLVRNACRVRVLTSSSHAQFLRRRGHTVPHVREILARIVDLDPLHVIPEVTALLLHQPHRLPIFILGDGSPTGTMSALAAWAFYLLGPSQSAASTAFAILWLTGKIAMYGSSEPTSIRRSVSTRRSQLCSFPRSSFGLPE